MFITLFVSIVLVFLMALPGYVASKRHWISHGFDRDVAYILTKVVYPCCMFAAIYQRYSLEKLCRDWYLPFLVFGMMLVGLAIGALVARFLQFKGIQERKAFQFQTLMNNFAFLPLALLPTVIPGCSDEAAGILLFAAIGGDAAVWTAGVLVASHERFHVRFLRHLFSAPLLAMYLALACRLLTDAGGITGWYLAESRDQVLTTGQNLVRTIELLGKATIPLAMLQVGSRLAKISVGDLHNAKVWIATGLRLAVIPAALLLALHWLPIDPLQKKVLAVVAVMPAATIGFTFSELFDMDKGLVSSTYLVTTLLAGLSVPLLLGWYL
jgi:predicted permease